MQTELATQDNTATHESDLSAEEYLDQYQAEDNEQSSERDKWDDIAVFCYPQHGQESERGLNNVVWKSESFTSIGVLAAKNAVSALQYFTYTPGNQLFTARANDEKYSSDSFVSEKLITASQKVTNKIGKSNFQLQYTPALLSAVTFGGAPIYYEYDAPNLSFEALSVYDCYPIFDYNNQLEAMIRKCKFTAKQAVDKFGLDHVGDQVKKAFETPKDRHNQFEFIHVTHPRKVNGVLVDPKMGTLPGKQKPYTDIWIDCAAKKICLHSGKDYLPYLYIRLEIIPGQKYGVGFGHHAYRELLQNNRYEVDFTYGMEMNVRPAAFTSDSRLINQMSLRPGRLSAMESSRFGGDIRQRLMFAPQNNAVANLFPVKQAKEEMVYKLFMNDAFLHLMSGGPKSATEWNTITKKDAERTLSMSTGIEEAVFNQMINNLIPLMSYSEEIDPLPLEIKDRGFHLEYHNELNNLRGNLENENMMQAISQAAAVFGTIQQVPFMATLVDAHKTSRRFFTNLNISPEILHSEDKQNKMIAEAQEQARVQAQNQQLQSMVKPVDPSQPIQKESLAGAVLGG